ncbi:MAG TPA: ATP-binding protein [Candidatus Lokiarchaeia archaeon]|nr:ATP-binding protein [Candidatus Lokiarchaeia archaeon]
MRETEVEAEPDLKGKEFHEILKKSPNPFDDYVVKDLWATNFIDVPEINKKLTDHIFETIQLVQDQKNPRIFLMLGEPGSGKSHVLARVQRRAEEFHKFLFVYIRPIGDITRINQHILSELMVSLSKKMGTRALTPLFQFIGGIISITMQDLVEKGTFPAQFEDLLEPAQPDQDMIWNLLDKVQNLSKNDRDQFLDIIIDSIVEDSSEIDATFMRVLFHLLDKEIRTRAHDWLKGIDLPEDDLKQLHVAYTLNSDDQAGKALQAFFDLAHGPILFCFDQIESIFDRFNDQDGMKLLFDHLMNFYNSFKNLAVILACNLVYWSESISPVISQAAKDRITTIDNLRSLDEGEAVLLVKQRMDAVWGDQVESIPYPTFPFTEAYVHDVARAANWNPRRIIRKMKDVYDTVKNSIELMEFPGSEALQGSSTQPSFIPSPATTSSEAIDESSTGSTMTSSDADVEGPVLQALLQQKLEEISGEIFQNEIKDISEPEWEDQLTGFLTDIFKECVECKKPFFGWNITKITQNLRKGSQKPLSFLIVFERASQDLQIKQFTYLIHITNTANGVSLASFLKRMKEYLVNNPAWKGVLIRDENLEIEKRYPASDKILQEFSSRMTVCYFPSRQIAIFLALKRMLESASSGDLQVGNHTVERVEAIEFVYSFLHKEDLLSGVFPDLLEEGLLDVSQTTEQSSPEEHIEIKQTPPSQVPPTVQAGAIPPATQAGKNPQVSQAYSPSIPSPVSEKILRILKAKVIVHPNQLAQELGMTIQETETICHSMAKQELITISDIKTDTGFLIFARPRQSLI